MAMSEDVSTFVVYAKGDARFLETMGERAPGRTFTCQQASLVLWKRISTGANDDYFKVCVDATHCKKL